jgi:uncharacterized protein YdeI (BOF family)
MKYRNIIVIITLIIAINLYSTSLVLAQDNSIDKTNNTTTSNTTIPNLTSTINNDPKTQDEANALIDSYIKQSFADSYYTDKSSIGEIKLVIKNKYLFTRQKIDFATVNYHIDKNFIFNGAEYTWRVKKGDKVLMELKDINKSAFFYEFSESGNYQIEVSVNSAGVIKTGSMNLDIHNKLSLDYRPLNPGKGDKINITTELPVAQYAIEWKVDGQTVESNNNKITFTENKGYKKGYFIEAIARDRLSGYIKYYGNTKIEIKEPEIRVSLVNNKSNAPIDFNEEININEPIQLLISSDMLNSNQNAKLAYTYRVNDKVQEGTGNSLVLDIDPNQSYKIDIVVKDNNGQDATAIKSFIVNKDKNKTALDANLSKASRLDYFKNDRYLGLGLLSIMGVMIMIMSNHSVLNKKVNK